MNKKITFKEEARQQLKIGVDALADAVKVTMGGKGRNVFYQADDGSQKITKDGVTVARQVNINDHLPNMGAQILKKVAQRTNEQAGDGTTTATVLAQTIFNDGLKYLMHGTNSISLNRGIQKAALEALRLVEVKKIDVKSNKQLKQVTKVSANGDDEVSDNVIKAFDKVGQGGEVSVQVATTLDTNIEDMNGFKIDKGYTSEEYVTDYNKGQVVLDNPLIYLSDKSIFRAHKVADFLDKIYKEEKDINRPILFICGLTGEAEKFVAMNVQGKKLQAATITPPTSGDYEDVMKDIATVTGGEYISHLSGLEIDQTERKHLGSADRVVIDRDTTIIIGGAGGKKAVQDRIKMIENQRKGKDNRYYQRMTDRLMKLRGKAAIIHVGGLSEIEIEEKKDRYEDAVNAVKAARQDGIVPGGGVALLRAYYAMKENKPELPDSDELIGYELLMNALQSPVKQISDNAGVSGDFIVDRLRDEEHYIGYNVITESFEDLVYNGIVDPYLVVKSALQNAASIAGMLLTTEATITFDVPKKK